MATLESRLADLITEIGGDVKDLQDDVAALGTPKLYIPFMFPGLQFAATATLQIPVPVACTFSALIAHLATAPTGGTTFKVDVNYNGTSIWTTQGNRPIWTASNKYPSYSAPDGTTSYSAYSAGSNYFTIDIDAVGSTIPGSDLAGFLVVQP